MRLNLNASLIVIFILANCLFSCKKEAPNNNDKTKHDVYVAGVSNGAAVYWKNGVTTTLSNSQYSCNAYGITVSDDNDMWQEMKP